MKTLEKIMTALVITHVLISSLGAAELRNDGANKIMQKK